MKKAVQFYTKNPERFSDNHCKKFINQIATKYENINKKKSSKRKGSSDKKGSKAKKSREDSDEGRLTPPPPPPDACASNPCQNGGTCRAATDSFTCACEEGFKGLSCQQKSSCSDVSPPPPPSLTGAIISMMKSACGGAKRVSVGNCLVCLGRNKAFENVPHRLFDHFCSGDAALLL